MVLHAKCTAGSTCNKKYIIPMYIKQTTGTDYYMKGRGWFFGAEGELILPIN